jgi:uncharacterized protein with FMN-binding domain
MTMRKSITAIVLGTAAVAFPVTVSLAGQPPVQGAIAQAAQAATKTPVVKAKVKPTPVAKARTYVGPSVDMQWGAVQVTIVVKGAALTSLSATAPTERSRSAFINGQAIPMLKQEVLQAKTVAKIKNIYGISGATMTSQAFYQSLLSALSTAHVR